MNELSNSSLSSVNLLDVTGIPLLILVLAEIGVCVRLPSKLTLDYVDIPAFRPCLPSRCLGMYYSVTV
jgi:hypothetical protein